MWSSNIYGGGGLISIENFSKYAPQVPHEFRWVWIEMASLNSNRHSFFNLSSCKFPTSCVKGVFDFFNLFLLLTCALLFSKAKHMQVFKKHKTVKKWYQAIGFVLRATHASAIFVPRTNIVYRPLFGQYSLWRRSHCNVSSMYSHCHEI